ncbi:hypothetical protein HNQ07_003426 [Deinococcus metalli]|uniref:Uncharacterized protein n=1 Tax=Deinococcus metalli TaxID=1141878 RepID=A0A7W8KJ61_9DEIO|nr:hypothetical protein [Deinococcus metalli]MBB5377926.1 hypothetical protein [Deinococcus metalli]GHF55064.1 hypothetical protein GCM10017781_34090 [Deinococcus metalli]
MLAVWLCLAGVALLFPRVGDGVFDLHLTNWGLASEYGGILVSLDALYWVFSTDTERYAPVMGVVGLALVLNVVITIYWWAVGHYPFQSAVFNVVINSVMAVWLWSLRPRPAGSARAPS